MRIGRSARCWRSPPRWRSASPAAAQPQTLADIKAELTVLNGQIEQLRNELVRSGAAGGLPADPATALTRLDQLEAELRRLTDRVDVLTNDVDRIVEDASNRVGDIEFRLTELEGGDTSVQAEPEPLGGGVTRPRPRPIAPAVAPEAPARAGGDRAVGLRRGGGGGRRRRQRQGGGSSSRPSSRPIRAGRCRPRRSSAAARRWRRRRTGAARRGAFSTPSAARRRTRWRRARSTGSRSASASSARPTRPA